MDLFKFGLLSTSCIDLLGLFFYIKNRLDDNRKYKIISWYQKHIFWYQKIKFLISENQLLFSDIKNSISWYQKLFFDI